MHLDRSGSGNLNSGDKWNFCLLCLAFRELGRVERTLFLLQYISQPQTRQATRAETTKIESFNGFLDWITFSRHQERRSGRTGKAAEICKPRWQRHHALERR
nr:transposase [Rhizobium leguminosarum]